jgi:MFS family permease
VSAIITRLRGAPPLLIVFFSVLIDMLGYGMIVPLLPFLVEGRDGLLIGLLSSLYALMQLVAAPILGALSDRVGRRPVLIFCLGVSGLAYMMLGLAGALWMFFLAVAVGGVGGASMPTAQAYIADSTPAEERARGLGLVGAAFGVGLMLGPALGGLLSVYGLRAPAFVAAGLALVNVTYALAALPESLPAGRRSARPVQLAAIARRLAGAISAASVRPLLLTIFLLNLAFAGLQSNFPLFSSERFGWGPAQNGAFFAFVGVCAVFTQGFLIGRLQPRLGEARLAIGGLALMALGLAAVAVAGRGWQLYPLVGGMALGSGLAIPALTSLVSRRAGDVGQGTVMGGMQALLSLTLVLGPALAGLLYDQVGRGGALPGRRCARRRGAAGGRSGAALASTHTVK